MDTQLEFKAQAFSKMVMHAMKHPYSICCGLLLSPKPTSNNIDGDENDENKSENQNGLDENRSEDEQNDERRTIKIIDAIPISHASHCLASCVEVALDTVSIFAQEQELVISGYYQTDVKCNDASRIDAFGSKRITEKIAESYPGAVLCFVNFEGQMAQPMLDLHHLADGNWQRRQPHSFKVENDPDVIAECILYSKEKLYRKIVDFDDYFNNYSLDWTNAIISQRIDYLVANIC